MLYLVGYFKSETRHRLFLLKVCSKQATFLAILMPEQHIAYVATVLNS